PLREAAVQAVLNLLACARGPLARDELLRLAPPAAGLNSYTLEEALRPLARLVAGDGARQGYAFSHPRLGAHFYERLAPAERRQVEQLFLDWGEQVLRDLNEGRLPPRMPRPTSCSTTASTWRGRARPRRPSWPCSATAGGAAARPCWARTSV